VSIEDFGVVNDPNGQFIAENTAAYLAAIARVNGQARLRHRAGLSVMVSSILMPSSGAVFIEHDGILKLAPAVNGPLIQLNGSGFTMRGSGVLDGNKAAQTGAGSGCAGINAGSSGASDIDVEGITIQNTYAWPVNGTGFKNAYFRYLLVQNCTNSFEFASGADNCWLLYSKLIGIPDDTVAFYQGVTNSGAIGNEITNGGAYGVIVLTDAAGAALSSNITVAFNKMYNMSAGAFGAVVQGTASGVHTDIDVSHNQAFNNCQSSSTPFDFYLAHTQGITAIGNKARQTAYQATDTQERYGMLIDSTVSDFVANSNRFQDIGSPSAPGVGLFFGGAVGGVASGNLVTCTTGKMSYAYAGSAGLGTIAQGNGARGPFVSSNAWNVTGQLAGAAQPITITGSSLIYDAPVPGTFVFSGGTITSGSFVRNGVSSPLGPTQGHIPMFTGDQISLNFTAAPTAYFLPGGTA
ncbi:MAG: hypothetical protein PHZ23_16370, partial [Acidiphilium sp.]|nr:hypothetical protein [Acidiphilium sp.]